MDELRRIEQRLEQRFKKALRDYRLISEGDHVLVALSGGKDSLYLLEALAKRSRVHIPAFTVSAVHVRMENVPYESDTSYLESFCERLGVRLHLATTSFDASTDRRHSPCFLCSWNRRKQIFNLAQELGCQKIALGHHQDDILHTALMNTVFEGRFSSMPVALKMRKMPVTLIRPLALCREQDIKAYAEAHEYQRQKKLCPYEHDTQRQRIAEFFQSIEALNPEARYSIWHALERDGKLVED
ncbi:MAG: tRNA 2-thiocytidine biosynthesis protein TtcA [Prevotella sp.]|nr:tRNA 2-thiocytidine biosynthesis protein TtcA [Prevotella sp.]